MKKVLALLTAMFCLFTTTAFAEGKLTVTQKNLILFTGEDTGYFYAKVENTGDRAVGVDSGNLVIFSDSDEILASENYVTTLPSYVVLAPGDYLYAKEYIWDSALKNAAIGDYKFSIPVCRRDTTFTKIACEATFELNDDYENYVYVTFTNTTDDPLYDCYITAALSDAEDNLIFVDAESLSNAAVHAGSTVTIKLHIDYDLIVYYKEMGITPVKVDAMVCVPNK